jgi:biofilm PGA synthesis N-glycosyltransferase PgaC
MDALFSFTFYYPLLMAYTWIIGALFYYLHRERVDTHLPNDPPELPDYPGISFLVPCHNEAASLFDTIESLLRQDYPVFEIIAINDASEDNTASLLDELATKHDCLRVIHFDVNQGKAMGLRMAAMASRYEYLICLDGDALLDAHASKWIMRHFVNGPRVGAVTGNPRVRNRSTLLGKIQVGEFSSIIGLIKRAQRIYGRIFTVSGVVAAYRKEALQTVGFWNLNTVTEDIDISWRLQLGHWDIRYEPNALCWILMPEKLKGLWCQRLRWAQGGIEALMLHRKSLQDWRSRRMWLVTIELLVSTFWAYAMLASFLLWVLGKFVELPDALQAPGIIPGWGGVLLGFTCLVQFAVSLTIDSRYEPKLGRFYYWMVWYPLVYWALQAAATCVAVPKALLSGLKSRGTWTSPDRGIRTSKVS